VRFIPARVIILALDGTAPDQLMQLIGSYQAPNLTALLGKDRGFRLFEHGYSAPRAWSILRSSTIATWLQLSWGFHPPVNRVTGDK